MASSTRSSLLSLVVAFAPLALAGESVEAQARRIALEGKKAFDTGDFPTAIARYQEAYKLKAAPGLLFNLGQCHRKTGALEEARSYLRRYLETSPPAAQAKATEQVLAEVEAQLAERRRVEEERAAQARDEAAQRLAEEEAARKAKEDELRVAAARAEAEAAAKKLQLELVRRQEPPPPPPTPITSRWWFWAGIATIVAAGATTAVAVGTAPRPTPTTFPDINAR
ncbi:MAG: tetratricopeptide repeat protein [Myxococcaceae bacterium]|nr:tetratricopeptide repeat protein [Myxococcaceae bacterium]